ncbi:MAG: SpaA isopeptide-forming pilin-related protein [Clostridium sp.]|nr:SpaA isopeptide-forming pilin-related protein [Clostridium sp.]
MKNFGKNKWMAIGLIIVMLFTLMPVNYNIGMGSFGALGNTATEQEEPEDNIEEQAEDTKEQVPTEQPEEIEPVSTELLTDTAESVSEQPSQETVTEEVTTESVSDNALDSETSEKTDDTKKSVRSEKAAIVVEDEEMDSKLATGSENLFVGTSIDLSNLTLEASYKDENGKMVVKNMTTTEQLELPKDAKIDMTFQFVIGNGNQVDCNKQYIYQVPPEVRVDVNNTHELKDREGKSIGNVTISSGGTLAFMFYEDMIKNQQSVPFYVKFAGGFSSSVQEDLGNQDIRFPTASGEFTYKVDVTDTGDDTENREPGEVLTYKSGEKVYQDGKPYIKWNVEIDKNGRDKLSAEVIDTLPAGLTFVQGQTIALQNEKWGSTGTVKVSNVSGQQVTFEVKDSDPNYRTTFSFLTSYDDSIFGSLGSIQNWSSATVDNTVAVNPEGEPTGSEGSGSAYVQPRVLEKSVVNSEKTDADGNALIEWMVVLNRDGMDIENSTYTDTLSAGLALVGGIDGVKVEPSGAGSIESVGDGFVFKPSANHKTITLTYTTTVKDPTVASVNQGKLTGGDLNYNLAVSATVPGQNVLSKRAVSYNTVTNLFTWEVVVNQSEIEMKNAVLEEIIPANAGDYSAAMELVSVSMRDAGSNAGEDVTDKMNGNCLTLGDIDTRKIITVVTRLKDDPNKPYLEDGRWYQAENTAKLTYGDGKEVSKSANYSFQYTKPNLMDKDGKMTGKGTIQWYLIMQKPQLHQEKMEITDVLPAGTELVEGSVKLLDRWNDYTLKELSGYQYDKTSNTLKLTLTENVIGSYLQGEFRIAYETRPTDYKNSDATNSYTNHAEVSATYEGDIQVTDKEDKTVTGDTGGTLGKEYAYQSGKDYVDWSVKINEGHYDMSDIDNPVIRDKLESYFDFISDDTYRYHLYRTTRDGVRSEVPAGDYTVVVINGNITVKLPKIGTDMLEFAFRTRFNISAERIESEGIKVKNTVDFEGDGFSKSDTSDEVNGVSFSSSSAGSVLEKELRIKKVDAETGKALEGAVFELFFEGVSAGVETTDEDGFAVFKGISSSTGGISYTLQENQAPDGYVKPQQNETVTITDAQLKVDTATQIRYIEHVVKNSPIEKKTELFVYKTDDNAAKRTSLKGAVFTLYTSQADAQNGRNAVASQTTSDNGIVKFTVDYSDKAVTYYIRETTAPDGYEGSTAIYPVNVSTDGTVSYGAAATADVTVEGGTKKALHVTNRKVKVSMLLTKVKADEDTVTISGAEFSLYSDANCTDFIEKKTTAADGTLTFADLELGKTYYYRETKAPDGYVINNTIYSFQAGTGKEHADVTVKETVTDDEALGLIRIKKLDDSTPAKALEGITFTLWQGDAQVNKPGTSEPYTVKTDTNGVAVFEQLPFGTYVVKEGDNTGYIKAADRTVVVNSTAGYDLEIVNEKIKFNVRIIKTDDSTPGKPLEGVAFGLYTSAGSLYKIGSTDKDGKLSFTDIPYGNYTLRETAGIKGYIMSTDVTAITTADIDADPDKTLSYTYINKKENASIRFQKRAQGNKTDNWLEGAEFTLYDSNGLKVATAVSRTNDGIVLFENLIYDTYTIRETKAPTNYKLDNSEWKVEVTENKLYTTLYNLDTGNQSIIENEELPVGYQYVSFYVMKKDQDDVPLEGAQFEFLRYVKKDNKWQWEHVQWAYSQADGKVEFVNVGISEKPEEEPQYQVREVAAPAGYKLDPDNVKTYTYAELTRTQFPGKDQVGHSERKENYTNVPVIETFDNEQILGKIRVLKTGLTSLNKLKGAVFGLYNQDGTEYQKNGKHYTATTDAEGIAIFEDLPIGYYIVKELEAPQGYTLNKVITPSVNVLNETTVDVTFTDTPISVTVHKYAVGGATELEGAELAVYDEEGNEIDKWTTGGSGTQHSLPYSKLKVGKRYTLKEIKAPDGYRSAADVVFEILEDGALRYISGDGSVSNKNVIMRDDRLSLKVRKVDADAADTDLVGALLEVIEDETNTSVYSFTSTGSVQDIPYNKLKAPDKEGEYTRYTIHEKSAPTPTDSAPNGYQLAEDIRIAIGYDGTVYRVTDSGMTPLADGTVVMEDKAKKAVYFSKLDAQTGNRIAGAELGIYSADGTELQTWISTTAPKEIELTPEDYIFREITAPDGYQKAAEIAFTLDDDGKMTVTSGDGSGLSYDRLTLSMEDEPLNIRMRKLNAEYAVLPGAKFELHESNANGAEGKLLQSFTTTLSSTVLDYTKLKEGGYYLLKETEAPKGYKIASPVLFYIKDGNAVNAATNEAYVGNLIQIVDDNKIFYINKVDAGTNQPMSGVTLRISSVADADFVPVEWVTDGKVKEFRYLQFKPDTAYILSETVTIGGYTYAKDINFSIHSADDELYIGNSAATNNQIVMKDTPFKVRVDKQIAGSNKPLAGAKLAVKNTNGEILEQWVTDGKAHELDASKLMPSLQDENIYTLCELEAPELYAVSQPIDFVVTKDGVVKRTDGEKADNNTLVMYDEYTGIIFSKQDAGGKEVPGAVLTITSVEDTEFTPISWTSTTTPYNLDGKLFKPNVDYILTETAAPDGYAYTESITFRVDENGTVYVNGQAVDDKTVTMVDDVLKLSIAKADAGKKNKLLAGAKFSILLEETDTVIYSWTSKGKAKEIPQKYLLASTDEERIIYVLRENKAPEGYELAEDIRFYIDSTGQIYILDGDKATLAENHLITLYDKKKDVSSEKKKTTKTTSKKTGDMTPVRFVVTLLLLSIAGLYCLLFFKKRNDRRR